MKTLKILFDNLYFPYKELPWNFIGSVFYTTFALWCFNLAVYFTGILIMPLIIQPDYIFESLGRFTSDWFISPYQLYYFWFCFVFSLILNCSE